MTYAEFMLQIVGTTPEGRPGAVPVEVPEVIQGEASYLSPKQRMIASMYAANADLGTMALAIEGSVTDVKYVLQNPAVQALTQRLMAQMGTSVAVTASRVNDRLEELSGRALEVTNTIMEDMFQRRTDVKAASLAAATAQDILNRAGHIPTKKVDVRSVGLRLNASTPVNNDLASEVLEVMKELRE